MDTHIQDFWQTYLKVSDTKISPDETYTIDEYGDSPELADELTQLILEGKKTATCCTLSEYEYEKEPLPKVGEKHIVVNGSKEPICIVETTEVSIIPFNRVDSQFAYEEGEDDRSLESWRREHWKYFSRVLPAIGMQPSEEMELVCVRFKVIYRPTHS